MGFKDTELGKIPLEWELCELKDKVNIVMGQSPKSEFYNKNKEGVPFMQGRTTFGDKYHEIDTWCTEPKRFANKADVLMSVRAPVGDVNIATMKLCIGRGLASLSMKNNNNEYLYYLLKNYVDVITSKGSGTVFSSVNKNDVETLKLPFAGDIEQKAIANILSSLDEKIELNNQMNKTLEEMAQALFKRWFVDFEFPNEDGEPYKSSGGEMVDSELGMIPKGWKVGYLDDIIEIYDAKRKPLSSRQRANMAKNYPYYGAASLVDYVENYLFDGIYVLISEDGANVVDADGYPLVQYVWDKFWVNNHAHIVKGKNGYSEEHIYILVKNTNMRSIVTGAVQPKINQANLKSVNIVIAQAIIIEKFNDLLTSVFNQYRSNAIENEKLKEMRDILLPKLMSGEIRVTDLQN